MLNYHRIWSEVDMSDFPTSALTGLRLDVAIQNTRQVLWYQVSSNGQYLGVVYCHAADAISSKAKIFVQLIDMRESKNTAKRWELHNYAADESIRHHFGPSTSFSADLSLLYDGYRLYNLNSATDVVIALQFPGVLNPCDSWWEVLFSPRNQFMCLIGSSELKFYEFIRSKRTLTEL